MLGSRFASVRWRRRESLASTGFALIFAAHEFEIQHPFMRRMSRSLSPWYPALWVLGLFLVFGVRTHAFDHRHEKFARILEAHVNEGAVDYAALKSTPAGLAGYLEDVALVTEAEFKAWTQAQQQAFLVNLYNAATLRLIADHYPVKSIKKIGGLFGSPWKLEVVRLWGRRITLDEVEHGLLRARYTEPRVHFALVCGAISCPPLRGEPYVAEQLDAQLTDQGRRFLKQTAKNRVDTATETLWLSPIFKWFAEDFTKEGKTIEEFVASFCIETDARRIRQGGLKVKYTDYDWSLNAK